MAKKWSYSTYGKSALGLAITLPDLDAFVDKITQAGKTLEEAAPEVIAQTAAEIASLIKFGAERHRRTGEVMDAVEAQPLMRDGDLIYTVVGVNLQKNPQAIEGVFQEYGDGHSPVFPDPFVRPAFEHGRGKFRTLTNRYLKLVKLADSKPGTKIKKQTFSNPDAQKFYEQIKRSNRIR